MVEEEVDDMRSYFESRMWSLCVQRT